MKLKLLSLSHVMAIHQAVIRSDGGFNPGSFDTGKLEGVLGRVETISMYSPDEVRDAFDLAALYAEVIARGHALPDGNKRTALVCAVVSLWINLTPAGEDLDVIARNVEPLQSTSFMTESMVLLAEGKLSRKEFKSQLLNIFGMTAAVLGAGFVLTKLIKFISGIFNK